MKKNIVAIIVMLMILIVSCSSQDSQSLNEGIEKPRGTIFFRSTRLNEGGEFKRTSGSYIISMPERQIHDIGYRSISSGQAISNDGNLLVIGCSEDITTLCIFKTSSIINHYRFVPDSNTVGWGGIHDMEVEKLPIPTDCVTISGTYPLYQMSWSFDKSKISIVCGDKRGKTLLCIINTDGSSICYPETIEKKIYYASWSPIDDRLVVSSSTYVDLYKEQPITNIFDPYTGKFTELFAGFSPAWSPSGDRIASFLVFQTDPFLYGIQVYSFSDNKNITIIPNEVSNNEGFHLRPESSENMEDCSISWSLDESQLVFSSLYLSSSNSTLFLYDFESNRVDFLIDPYLLDGVELFPQWSPFLFENEFVE